MKKNLLSLLTLAAFLGGCSVNKQDMLEAELASDEPISNRSKANMEAGSQILSQVPDDYLIDYFKAVIEYRSLLKQQSADQGALEKAKQNFHIKLKEAMSNVQDHKIPYDKAKGAMLLSKISASKKSK